jgi:hypothetical protein
MFESKGLKQENLAVRLGIPTVNGGEDVNEQFVSNRLTLEALFPNYPTKGMVHINGKPSPHHWIPLPQEFGSEEEAIEYLNSTLRSCEVMETSHIYID